MFRPAFGKPGDVGPRDYQKQPGWEARTEPDMANPRL